MEKFKNKLKDRGGFTLIEMLIVVAIIAILVAISIPLVNSALERAREATDAANERSFKAVLTISYLNGKYEVEGTTPEEFNVGTPYIFDAAKGTITNSSLGIAKYGKSTTAMGTDGVDRRGMCLYGYVGTNGVPHMAWSKTDIAVAGIDDAEKDGGNLISPKAVGDL